MPFAANRVAYAVVTGKGRRELRVEPVDRRVTYHQVNAREVLEIWHKRRRRDGNAAGRTDER